MTQLVTLLAMRTNARQMADMVNSTFCTDAEINGYLNDSISEMWDIIIQANEGYFQKTATLTCVSPAYTVALPSDFYKFRGLDDLNIGSQPVTVHPFNFEERNDYQNYYGAYNSNLSSRVRYNLIGNNVEFRPTSNAPGTYTLHYIPTATQLVADGDTIDSVNGWHDLVQVDTGIKMVLKEEGSTTVLERRKADIVARLEKMTKSRDMGRPRTITNVRTNFGPGPYLNRPS